MKPRLSLNKSQPLAFCVDICLAAEPWIMHFNQPESLEIVRVRQWQVTSSVSKPLDQDGNQAFPINVPSLSVVLPASLHLSASEGVWVSPSLLQTVADLPK